MSLMPINDLLQYYGPLHDDIERCLVGIEIGEDIEYWRRSYLRCLCTFIEARVYLLKLELKTNDHLISHSSLAPEVLDFLDGTEWNVGNNGEIKSRVKIVSPVDELKAVIKILSSIYPNLLWDFGSSHWTRVKELYKSRNALVHPKKPMVALRKDELEKTYAVLKSGKKGNLVHELVIHTKDKEIVLNPEATVSIDLPRPKNIMIYCFGAIADGPDNQIPGGVNGDIWFDKKFREFGDHILIITNPKKFCDRLNSVIETHENLYSSEYFEGGYGQVDYVNMDDHMGPIGMFRKDYMYSWQREYRLCFGANTEALNSKGALELRIGDLSDISEIVPIDKFLASPVMLKRRIYQKKGGEFVQVRK